ncbi:MATE family efflux transporter [Kangiella marina]|uniref:Multidrug-efflux transporter n=1 Tax=Kangiella marina TaxID=1079178 RepID=A0ABP8IPM7_9GAMM
MEKHSLRQIGEESSALIKVAIPAILAQLAQMTLGVVDTVMAGNYSKHALAAVGTGANAFMIIFALYLGLSFALNPMVSHYNGQGQFKKIGKTFQMGIFIAIAFGIVGFFILRSMETPLLLMGVTPDISGLTADYLTAMSWGTIPAFLFLALRASNEGLFSTKAIMICSFMVIPFNILFNTWFIYGGFGLPAMGAVGVGYATSVVWTLLFVFLLIYTYKNSRYEHLNIFKNISWPKTALIKEYFSIGTPIAVGMLMEVGLFGMIGIMVARYGVDLTGAHQIAMNIATVAFMVPLGLSVAITARVGFWRGKQDFQQMRLAGFCGIGISVLFQALSVTLMLLFRHDFVGFYTDNPELIQLAASLIFLAAIFQFSDGLQINSAGALRGMKDTKIPMIYMAVAYWMFGFPIGYYLAEYQGLKVQGFWIGIIVGLSIAAILLLSRFIRRSKHAILFAQNQ